MINIKINITASMILGYLILIIGTVYSFYTKNAEVLIFTASLSAGLLGLRNWNDTRIRTREIENNVTVQPTPVEQPQTNEPSDLST